MNLRDPLIDLAGKWRFRTDPEDLGEHYRENLDEVWAEDARWMRPDYDDSDWDSIAVPSCWQEAGYDYNGVAWYRKIVDLPEPAVTNERLWLRFDGVDYYCDVWCNGYYLGSHEGYFDAFEFEITPFVKNRTMVLAVRVDSPQDIRSKERQEWQLKTLFKGALQRWDVNNPLVNPGGIWNRVSIYRTGPVKIEAVDLKPVLDDLPSKPLGECADARLITSVRLHVAEVPAAAYDLTLEVRPPGEEGPVVGDKRTLPRAHAYLDFTLSPVIDQAKLWYSWDLGCQPLYTAAVTVSGREGISDTYTITFGIRTIHRGRGWETFLNGHRVFQRGANYLSDQFLARMDRSKYERDVTLARRANLNTLHPFCVVEKQEFYDECDRQGVLVYQDFPMWLMMSNASDLVRRGVDQMGRLITQFNRHPSIIIWNCGSQPSRANFMKLGHALVREASRRDPGRIAHQANALLDYTGLQQATRRNPIGDFHWTEESAAECNRDYDWRTDTHQYFGWYYGKELSDLNRIPIHYLELVTEYGAQALPAKATLEAMLAPHELFPPRWTAYARHCFQYDEQFFYIPKPGSLEEFIAASQEYQARFIRYHTEYYRRHTYAPCNGAHLFCFNDCWPAITWSVLDYDRRPKLGYFALKRAMAPVQVLVEIRYRFSPSTGPAEFPVWLVNDTGRTLQALRCLVTVELDETPVQDAEYATDAGTRPCLNLGTLVLTNLTRPAAVQVSGEGERLEITARLEDAAGRILAQNYYLYVRVDHGRFEFRGNERDSAAASR